MNSRIRDEAKTSGARGIGMSIANYPHAMSGEHHEVRRLLYSAYYKALGQDQ